MNKMAEWFSCICVTRGSVSWGSEDDTAGELQLWYRELDNCYRIYASNTAGGGCVRVRKVIDHDVFTLHFHLPKVH